MRTIIKLCGITSLAFLFTACSDLVQLKPGADAVHIYTVDNVQDCPLLGSVQVSVLGKVGPFNRDQLAVENELNILAKNSAVASGGNAVMAISPVKDGARNFNLYKCKAP